MLKIVFICKDRSLYGKSYGLRNSAQFVVNYLNTQPGYNAKVVMAVDGNSIDKILVDNNPDCVILEALWVTPEKLKELTSLPRHKKRLFIVRLHSKFSFLSNEGIAFEWLNGYSSIGSNKVFIAPNNLEVTESLQKIYYKNVVYLPNIYQPPVYEPCIIAKNPEVLNVGCFGAIRPMKNHLTQAIAAINYAKENGLYLKFHINGNRLEQKGTEVLKNLQALFSAIKSQAELVEHDWMDHEQFVKLIRQMDLGMQVSFSETFNIVTADFIVNYVPVVASQEISWLSNQITANPNSVADIETAIKKALGIRKVNIVAESKAKLNVYNYEASNLWNLFLYKV